METNKNNKFRFFIVVLSLGLAIMIAISLLFYNNNKELENQILKRDSLIKKTVISDSNFSKQKTKSDSIILKYIDDCGIRINNKKVTTDELLQYINLQSDEINQEKKKNDELSDSLNIYKSYVSLSKENLNVNYSTRKENNKLISKITMPSGDSLKIYKSLYELMKENYGISYKVSSTETTISYAKQYTKLDSALFVYKHYKYVLSTDPTGNLLIDLPTEKQIKNSTSNRGKR
jgi:hypothetical protein